MERRRFTVPSRRVLPDTRGRTTRAASHLKLGSHTVRVCYERRLEETRVTNGTSLAALDEIAE